MRAQEPSRLDDVTADIQQLLNRHRVLTTLARQQSSAPRDRLELLETLQQRQNTTELERRLAILHPADLAHILNVLPLDDRRPLWEHVPERLRGLVLVELTGPVRGMLIEWLGPDGLRGALATLDPDDLSYLADDLPADVLAETSGRMEAQERDWLRETIARDEHTAGGSMSSDVIAVRETATVGEALDTLRKLTTLPGHTDRIFLIDSRHVLRGQVPIAALVVADQDTPLATLDDGTGRAFEAEEGIAAVARAFERYDLVSAPVVDWLGKLVGRLTSDIIFDYVRAEAQRRALEQAGLTREEDLFAPIMDSARNRWPWLLVNVITAFIASRVIGVFAPAIQSLIALATLMPIVASLGGNTGNQTVALVIRGLALDRLPSGSTPYLLRKELTIGAVNGVVWGGALALCALALYQHVALALVMGVAVVLNLLVAALTGVLVPLGLRRIGRDPAQGASVLLTFVTDTMGFFLFLGLATAFLV